MKLNIAHSLNGTVKSIDCNDDHIRKAGILMGMRLGQVVDGKALAPELAGYTFKMRGGSDKQGFPMVPGVLANARVSLLVARGRIGFQRWRARKGERTRTSLRGAIMATDIAQLNVTVVREGENPIEGLTDVSNPRRLGPKRASKIRKLFNLSRDDDVKNYVVKRKVEKGNRVKAPKVQRLITNSIRARRAKKVKVAKEALKKNVEARREYLSMVTKARLVNRQRRTAKNLRVAKAQTVTAGKAGKKSKNRSLQQELLFLKRVQSKKWSSTTIDSDSNK